MNLGIAILHIIIGLINLFIARFTYKKIAKPSAENTSHLPGSGTCA